MGLPPLPELDEEEHECEASEDSQEEWVACSAREPPSRAAPSRNDGEGGISDPDGVGETTAPSVAAPALGPSILASAAPSTDSIFVPASPSKPPERRWIRAVVGGKTIRSYHACLHLACLHPTSSSSSSERSGSRPSSSSKRRGASARTTPSDDGESPDAGRSGDDDASNAADDDRTLYVGVRLQFVGRDIPALKSLFRRAYKHRDLIRLRVYDDGDDDGDDDDDDEASPPITTPDEGDVGGSSPLDPSHPRYGLHRCHTYVIRLSSVEQAHDFLRVEEARYWDVATFQAWQHRHLTWLQPSPLSSRPAPTPRSKRPPRVECEPNRHPQQQQQPPVSHFAASSLDRERQAQYVANFLFHMVLHKLLLCHEQHGQEEIEGRGGGAGRTSDDLRSAEAPPRGEEGPSLPALSARSEAASEPLRGDNNTSSLSRGLFLDWLGPPEGWPTTSPHDLWGRWRQIQSERREQHANDGPSRPPPATADDEGDTDDTEALARHYFRSAIEVLNSGGGVLDVAGGSGFVSLALASSGIRSTVVDPRARVGHLPKRHRKAWRKKMMLVAPSEEEEESGEAGSSPLPPPVMFLSRRAWFGPPPSGVDDVFRPPDRVSSKEDGSGPRTDDDASSLSPPQQAIPGVVDETHEWVRTCSALVALHPDEATDAAVDAALQLRIPFCVVPCCVFSRLFPHRQLNDGRMVRTHAELLDYLCEKHPTIRRTSLPFLGSNTLLWSTF